MKSEVKPEDIADKPKIEGVKIEQKKE